MSDPAPPQSPSQAPPEKLDPTTRRVLFLAFLTVALDLLGFGIIIPIQPFYAESYGASPTMVTLLGASYSLMQFLFAPMWGALSDRVGRRPVVLISVLLGTVGYLLFGLAGSLGALFFSRMLSGFGNANIATIQAIVADSTTGAQRAKGMGLIGAAFGVGFVFGPVLGGVLGQWGLAYPAYGAAVLGLLNLIFAAVMLPETHPKEARQEQRGATARRGIGRIVSDLKRLASSYPDVTRLVIIGLVMTTGFAMVEQSLGLFIERVWVPEAVTTTDMAQRRELLRHAAQLTTYLLVAIGLTAAVVQGGLIGPLARRFGERRLIIAGLVGVALAQLGFVAAGQIGIFWLMLPVGVLLATSTGVTTPSLNSLLSRSVSRQDQGAAAGLGQSASALGRVVGPGLAGMLFEWHMELPFFSGAALLVLVTLVAVGLRGNVGDAQA